MFPPNHVYEGYRIECALTPGDYGIVYIATRISDGERVALKFCTRLNDADAVTRFENENQILHHLHQHPQVIEPLTQIIRPGDGNIYYAMELADLNLEELITGNTPLTDDEKLAIFKQLCEGLKHAHGKTVVHRDLHYRNILVKHTPNPNGIKLTDFGLAKDFQSSIHSLTPQAVWGAGVMPPEMIFRVSDTESLKEYIIGEIYALGFILFWTFTTGVIYLNEIKRSLANHINGLGVTNYYGLPEATRRQHYINWLQNIDPAIETHLDIPLANVARGQQLTAIVKKMCHADTTQRYQTVDEVINAMKGL